MKEVNFVGLQKLNLHNVFLFSGWSGFLCGLKEITRHLWLAVYVSETKHFLERVPNILRNYIFLFLGWAEKLITYMCTAVNVLKTKHFLERGHFVGHDLR